MSQQSNSVSRHSKSKAEQQEIMRYCQYKAWTNRGATDACPANSPSIKSQHSSASPVHNIYTRKESDEPCDGISSRETLPYHSTLPSLKHTQRDLSQRRQHTHRFDATIVRIRKNRSVYKAKESCIRSQRKKTSDVTHSVARTNSQNLLERQSTRVSTENSPKSKTGNASSTASSPFSKCKELE